MQSLKVHLPRAVRYFKRYGYTLSKTDDYLSAGSEVRLGKPVPLFYDHCNQQAAPFIKDGLEFYVLVEEVYVDGLFEKLDRLPKFELVKG